MSAARQGVRVLLTEIGEPDGDYTPLARLFGRDTMPGEPVQIGPGIQGCTLWPRKGHEMFFRRVIPVGALVRAAMRSTALRKLLESAPSFREMGVFYHLFWLLEQTRADGEPVHELVIVDMPASGHTLGLTGLRQRLLAIMPTGPIARVLNDGAPYFEDPTKTGAYIVTLPETLPVTEAVELAEGLISNGTPVGGIFLNRVLPDPFSAEERAALKPFATDALFGMARYRQVPAGVKAAELLRNSTDQIIEEVPELPLSGQALWGGFIALVRILPLLCSD
jgi:anion-transporting  ArsA/GET3 family ATPase